MPGLTFLKFISGRQKMSSTRDKNPFDYDAELLIRKSAVVGGVVIKQFTLINFTHNKPRRQQK